ncbi:MAG: flippase-like domain-containing protein [Candidatus Promineofilum sp.]|nr:flippase-like domain-containing protein [Promineifilum sp.]
MRSMSNAWRRSLPLLNLVLTGGLIVAGIWYLSTRLDLAAILDALSKASVSYTVLAVFVMLATMVVKAIRWQLMFSSQQPPVRLSASFWATSLAQYINLVVPFIRLGEVARLYALNREAGVSPGRGVGTLVVEKTLDLIFFGLTILLVIPFVVFPEYVNQPGPLLMLLPLILFTALYLLAYQTELVITIWRRVTAPFPPRMRDFLLRLAVSGLEGLAALRDRRLNLLMLLLSLLIAGLSIALPYILFLALSLPLTFLDAALVHIVVSIAIVPPSTPAKIGVLNGAAALVLWQLGISDEANIAAYAILLYLVVVVPQIIVGLIATSRTKWSWQMTVQPSLATEVESRRP